MVEMSSLHVESNAQLARTPIVRVSDDDDKVRRSWQFVLEGEGWQVQAYESAVRFLKEDDPQVPGCIVCDVRMPEMNGLELQDEMLRRGIDLPIVFLAGHGDISMAVMALQKGAGDFCEKPVAPERLRQTVRRLSDQNIEARKEKFRIDMMRNAFETLTQREKEIIRMVADDNLNKEIANDLGIQEHTVKLHRAYACKKLGVRSALEAHKYLAAIGEVAQS